MIDELCVDLVPASGDALIACKAVIVKHHYTHSIPSGKSYYFRYRGAVVCFSIPANMNLGKFILKRPCVCWELARLWAKDGHPRNLLTQAIAKAISGLRKVVPDLEVLVSFADPNVGHEGFVYRAASWIYSGQSEDSRGYIDANGVFYPRRKFHSGGKGLTKKEIEAKGFKQVSRFGKFRYVKGITRQARKAIRDLWEYGPAR